MTIKLLNENQFGGSGISLASKINELIKEIEDLKTKIKSLENKLDSGIETPYGKVRNGGFYD